MLGSNKLLISTLFTFALSAIVVFSASLDGAAQVKSSSGAAARGGGMNSLAPAPLTPGTENSVNPAEVALPPGLISIPIPCDGNTGTTLAVINGVQSKLGFVLNLGNGNGGGCTVTILCRATANGNMDTDGTGAITVGQGPLIFACPAMNSMNNPNVQIVAMGAAGNGSSRLYIGGVE